jgi:hypothetical protein
MVPSRIELDAKKAHTTEESCGETKRGGWQEAKIRRAANYSILLNQSDKFFESITHWPWEHKGETASEGANHPKANRSWSQLE